MKTTSNTYNTCNTPDTSDTSEKKIDSQDHQHPEDKIFKVREFIQELENVQSGYFEKLADELKLNQLGKDHLFDFVHNCEDQITFDEYLQTVGLTYQKCMP